VKGAGHGGTTQEKLSKAKSPAPTCWVRISPLVYTMLGSLQPYRSKFSRKSQRDSSKLWQGGQEQCYDHRTRQILHARGKGSCQEAGSLLRPLANLWEQERGRKMGTNLTEKSPGPP